MPIHRGIHGAPKRLRSGSIMAYAVAQAEQRVSASFGPLGDGGQRCTALSLLCQPVPDCNLYQYLPIKASKAAPVGSLGPGQSQNWGQADNGAARERGWRRGTVRQGTHEVESGFACLDAFTARGRKPVEAPLPILLRDRLAIVESQSQTAPQ